MIDPKELRIGNFVLFKGVLFTINDADNLAHIQWSNESFEPIPITPEWLERLGFIVNVCDTFTWYLMIGFEVEMEAGFYYYNTGRSTIGLLYIHQLQNIFYSLTGTELEIK